MNFYVIRNFILVLSVILLTGCAGTYRAYIDTLSYAFSPQVGAQLTLDQVNAASSDLLYLSHGERPQVVLALAFIEQGQQKWISADQVVMVIEQGRVVRTAGLQNDLLNLTNRGADPLKRLPAELFRADWLRLADWRQGEYGYQIRSEFKAVGQQDLQYFGKTISTLVYEEYLDYPNQANFVGAETSWRNTYWFDSVSGMLLQSQQQLSPQAEPMLMTYISRINRALKEGRL
ncbi:YjbF family lipoprotein [Arsukibacterium indicum]|uniref:YjbF family lipoprotein n=1 Tax=Arsukibacterium indicum TaxID=2848612 RepID=A0ABS6MGJ2_9GAMM|nr:YjbF family lipoprotein [Arsukibacterium indicum]MBV2127770.1 YjbF family lipoprotein [Arsukibacterium indicum]